MTVPSRVAQRITPVIVTYNSASVLPWSLPALSECHEVIVVDNSSRDRTVAIARELLPQVRVIEASGNLGFGRANNLGLAAVTTDFALLHNPDARLEPGALAALAAAAERYPEAAILAPVLYDAPGRVGDFFRGPFWAPASHPAPEPAGDLCAEFVTGAAMLLNMRLMRGVGFFDPWFFLYAEDDDLCLRVRRAGHPIVVAADARMEHHARSSSPPTVSTLWRRAYCMTLSKLYLTRKYLGTPRCVLQAMRIGIAGALTLPLLLVLARRERVLRQAARVAAVAMAWRHLRRAHCFEPAG
jgi:GT2 family glycosyltransferase